MRKVFITRNRATGFHELLEVIPSSYEAEHRGTLDLDTLNALIHWKTLDEMVSVLSKTGPMIASPVLKNVKRTISINEAIKRSRKSAEGRANREYCENDEAFLRMQLQRSGFEGPLSSTKASISRDIKKHGLLESSAIEELSNWALVDPNCRVAIEPLSDIVYMRNLCSIILRIIANYQSSNSEHVLEASGFQRKTRSGLLSAVTYSRTSYYVMPLRHDSSNDAAVPLSGKHIANTFKLGVLWPLPYVIFKARDARRKSLCFDYVTADFFTGQSFLPANAECDIESHDTMGYVAINDDIPQKDAASQFIVQLAAIFRDLSGETGEMIGWDFLEIPCLERNEDPVPTFYSLAAAMIGSLLFRMGKLPVTCKNCGTGMMIKDKGKRREFCSDSCRTLYSKIALDVSEN